VCARHVGNSSNEHEQPADASAGGFFFARGRRPAQQQEKIVASRNRIDVGILGATGMVGQQFIVQLANHPWFRIAWLGASERSEGRKYRDLAWRLSVPRPAEVDDLVVEAATPGRAPHLMFSGLDSKVARDIEQAFASAGHVVVSNARNFRMEQFVPLLIPEVNPDHLALLPLQRQAKGWKGAIVTNPNCATVPLAMALAAARRFKPTRVVISTMQAVSGAGYPGVPSLDILGNVVPFIDGEEEKIQSETQKILGALTGDRVVPHAMVVSASTTRVPVINGHTETISVEFGSKPTLEDLMEAFRAFTGKPQEHECPSAPKHPLIVMEEPNRPQPRVDVEREGGMAVFIGRVRPCPVFDYKFVALGHNTVRGAAGAAVLNAELMLAEKLLD
jgi:aspartate-semialdehyde dehydrogenase